MTIEQFLRVPMRKHPPYELVSTFCRQLERQMAISPDEQAMRRERIRLVRRWVARLSERERTIITLRFGLDGGGRRTLQEIADTLQITRERVRQVEAGVIRYLGSWLKLRARLHRFRELPENTY